MLEPILRRIGIAILIGAVSCPAAPASTNAETNAKTAPEGLRALTQKHGIHMGAAVGGTFWNGADKALYRETLKREYDILVPENAMKFDQVEPSRGKFHWAEADELVAFAEQNGMQVRGHNLVWHQSAGWAETSGLGRTEMLAVLRNHADSLFGRYRGRIAEWDVVNEAVDDATGNLRDTFWRKAIGDDYLDSAFHFAHRADPQALLFYNDYSAEGMGGKSDKVYALVKAMKERGVPIHGVGFQCHFDNASWPKPADIDRNMKRLAALGLSVSITELDFRVKLPADTAGLASQKESYRTLLGVCLSNANCKSFLTWGFTDAYSWVPSFFSGSGAALPFDAQYRPKPAYEGLREGLASTSLAPKILRPGEARASGMLFKPGAYASPMFREAGTAPAMGIFKVTGFNATGKWLAE